MMSRTICLSGMMGAGKTTVAEVLGRRLGRAFVDTDREIERWTGRSVARIFAEGGETAFRDLERQVVVEVARVPDLVVALGGGTVLRDDTVADLMLSGVIVHLDVPVNLLAERLAPQREHRPLLRPGPDAPPLHEVVEEVLAARRKRYAEVADLVVDAAGEPEAIADVILAWAMEAGDVLTPSEHEQVMP
jgi:shikimate kinase